ncbi:MAG: hypothetical protein HY901_03090 [Deltaproteobacteria bacterium]|nr:hypothetical protein [Deltaproteobacteria bacterium]
MFTGTGLTRTAGGESLLYHLAAYTVTAVGAFGVAAAIERKEESPMAWDLDRFSGLAPPPGAGPPHGHLPRLPGRRRRDHLGHRRLLLSARRGAHVPPRSRARAGVPEPRAATLDGSLGLAFVLVLALGPARVLELARLGANLLF